MQEFQPDDTINNRYKVLRKLGAGAMGSVYLCEDSVENHAKVALKVLISENLEDQDIWAKGEYEALTRLRHPNLAKVYNFGRIGSTNDYFIVSEFIKGIDLFSATEYLNYEEIADILVQICRALEYIHSQGYVHFDIKPDNILVTRYKTAGIKEGSKVQYEVDPTSTIQSVYAKPNVKVIDFGLAEKITGSFSFAIKGTLNYLAPEILNGQTPDKRADLYSLGVTLYQVANRNLPFYQDVGVLDGTGGRANLKRSELFELHMKKHPEFLQTLIMKLLEERPEDRFLSAREIIQFVNKESDYQFELETAETRESYFYSPRLVGRRRESNLLREYYERMFLGDGKPDEKRDAVPPAADADGPNGAGAEVEVERCAALLSVVGEMGSGKSRLLEEFEHYLRLNDVPFFVGNCYEENTKAYQPLVEILRQLVFRFGLDSDFYQTYRQEISRLIPDLRRKGGEDAKPSFRPDKQKIFFIERIAQLLIDAARQCPYVLVINNLQWMDEASIDLLEKLLEHVIELRKEGEALPLLVISSQRPEEAGPQSLADLLERLRREGQCKHIPIRSLKQAQIHEFLCSMLNFSDVPSEFVARLEETTGGNPLFIVETLKTLENDGIIKKACDGWVIKATSFEKISIPRNMEELLSKRVATIDSPRRELLGVLSVVGKPISPKFLQSLKMFANITVFAPLRDLEQLGVVGKVFEGGKLHFEISQSKMREIIYNDLTEAVRGDYHGEIAEALESLYSGREEEILEDLAYHYQRSDRRAKAIGVTLRAGDWLRGIFANERAFDSYAYVLEQVEGVPEQFSVWVETQQKLADLCVIMGRYDAAERSYSMFLNQEVQDSLGPDRLVRIHLSRGKVFEIQGDYESALRCYKDARNFLSTFEKSKLSVERVRVFNSIGWVYVCMGKYEKAMTISLEALRLIQGEGECIEHAMVYNTIGSANFFKGNVREAIKYHRQSLEIREHLENIPEITTSLNNLGSAYMAGCDYGEALEHLRRAMSMSEAIGDPYGKAVTYHNFARLYFAVSQPEKGLEALEESLKLSKAFSMKYLNTQNYIVRGNALRDEGNYSKAEANLFRVLSAYTKQGNRWGLCVVLLYLSELHRLCGNPREARTTLDEAWGYAKDLQISHLLISCHLEEARLIRADEDHPEVENALILLDKARFLAEKIDHPELLSEVFCEIGETLVVLRRLPEAESFYKLAQRKYREVLDNQPEEFRCSYAPPRSMRLLDLKGSFNIPTPRKTPKPAVKEAEPTDGSEVVGSSGISSAEDSLRRVSQLMGLMQSGQGIQAFLGEWLSAILAVLQVDMAFWLTVRGDNVSLESLSTSSTSSLGRVEDLVCLEYVERTLRDRSPIFIAEASNDPLMIQSLGPSAAKLGAAMLFPAMIQPDHDGVLYLLEEANKVSGLSERETEILMQPFVTLIPLAYMQLKKEPVSA